VGASVQRYTLFLDDGEVMNDNSRRGPQWRRLLGEFLTPRLGASPEAWAKANLKVVGQLWGAGDTALRDGARDFGEYLRRYRRAWLLGMCQQAGVAPPPDAEVERLVDDATRYVCRRVRAGYPGAAAAIRRLRREGFALHTASSEPSLELAGYLEGMGVRDCFGGLYGPDLVGVWKDGPEYYARIFARAGVDPGNAIVIDDSPAALGWAMEAGARAVRVGPARLPAGAMIAIPALKDLPAAVARLA
jgi:HAD superfamily hydrolase (TIGR01509 family)